ncbi:hypothetical protein PS718_00968 [Pseudomonas fluorescens]|uniref:HNH domain-containing protein n=1 Tax=Pseudomonas fluorescens TaxID=294 RepID=A0A5E7AIR0_PSEFL|nr:hypothetical protein [Pseudomonas fluorescens]VVN79248.1 hypothetical protein PS718_00968 [Pseudomonas fluorescens]
MIIRMPDNWQCVEAEHNAYVNTLIDGFIDSQPAEAALLATNLFLRSTRALLVSGDKQDLDGAISAFIAFKKKLPARDKILFLQDLKALFDYKKFSNRQPGWDAYKLCDGSKLRTCPYCNHAYAFTLRRVEKGLLRPTLDHFYSKSQYPHLALTLINLIPSCNTCNSSLKSTKNFYKQIHLHPFFDEERISFRCEADGKEITEICGKFAKLKPQIKIVVKSPRNCKASKNSIKTFALDLRYNELSHEGIDFITAQSRARELLANIDLHERGGERGKALDLKVEMEEELLRFNRKRYNSYLLGKMYADLYDLFKAPT